MSVNLRGLLVAEATKWLKVRESGGANCGPEVEEFQRTVDGKAQGEPWCLCFIQYCITKVEQRSGVDSPLFRTEHVLTCWNNSPLTMRAKGPQQGHLILWRHGDTTSGHIGIIESVGSGRPVVINTIEGNTAPGAGVIRDGDGVYLRQRYPMGAGSMRVVGYLNPWP